MGAALELLARRRRSSNGPSIRNSHQKCEQLRGPVRIQFIEIMPPNALASTHEVAEGVIGQRPDSREGTSDTTRIPVESTDSLFERVAWLYAFCRERLFRDDTDRMI